MLLRILRIVTFTSLSSLKVETMALQPQNPCFLPYTMLFHTAYLPSKPLLRPSNGIAGFLPVQNGAPLGPLDHLCSGDLKENQAKCRGLMKKTLESGLYYSTLKIYMHFIQNYIKFAAAT